MFAIPKHRKSVSVFVTGAEVCVASVFGVTQVRQGQGEDLIHLEEGNRQTVRLSNVWHFYSIQFKKLYFKKLSGSLEAMRSCSRPLHSTIY